MASYRWRAAGSVALALALVSPLAAQSITRVEEDWEAYVVEASADLSAPQMTALMTPNAQLPGDYFSFEINHSTQPDFAAGGLQIQSWSDDEVESHSMRFAEQALDREGERLRWTQRLAVDEGHYVFSVLNFQSATWGSEVGEMSHAMPSGSQHDLNAYQWQSSLQDSKIGFASNRVGSMRLVQVRLYSGDSVVAKYDVNAELSDQKTVAVE